MKVIKNIAATIVFYTLSMLLVSAPALLLLSVPNKCSAQYNCNCFVAATVPNLGLPPAVSIDERMSSHAVITSSNNLWFDGTVSTLVYPVAGTPDVRILNSAGNNYALVVYFSSYLGGSYVYDLYIDGIVPAVASGTLEAPALGASGIIHIDAAYNGYYEIVWDDYLGIQDCANSFPLLPSVHVTIGSGGSAPSVAVGISGAYYICSGGLGGWGWGPSPVFTGGGGGAKIACDYWGTHNMVVYGSSHILGSWDGTALFDYTDPVTPFTSYNCTDLTQCPQGNSNPAVTFSSSGNVIVAWIYMTGGTVTACPPSPPGAILPIAVNCDPTGKPINPVISYMAVDPSSGIPCPNFPILTTGSYILLSGKNASFNNIFYAWDYGSKDVPWGSPNLRTAENNHNTEFASGVYPNPNKGNFFVNVATEVDEPLTIEVYNSLGQKVYSTYEVSTTLNFTKEVTLNNHEAGLYFVRVAGKTTTNNWKIILSK